jgi:cytochrome c-type biogenesis protein CcmH
MRSAISRLAAALFIAVAAAGTASSAAPAAAQPASQGAVPAADAAPRVVRETLIDRQTRELASQLRCVVCQGLSIQDSPSQLAQEMRAIIREKLEEGMTPAEVRVYFIESYGEWVLLAPEARGFNLVVYVMPVMMLFGGGAFVYFRARRWTDAAPAAAEPEAVDA